MNILKQLPPKAKKGEMVAMDTEFFGQSVKKLHRPHGVFACITVVLERDLDTAYIIQDWKELKALVKLVKDGMWTFHNAMYDLTQLRPLVLVELDDRFIWDTMLVEQSMQGGYYRNFSLKDLARRYLGLVLQKEARDEFEGSSSMTEEMIRYAAYDSIITAKIALNQMDKFKDGPGWKAYLTDQRMMWPLLEINGVRVDADAWQKSVKEFTDKATQLQDKLGINVNSSAQVIKYLNSNGLHVQNTQAKTLLNYADRPDVQAILETRMYRKAVSTYGTKWLENHVELDGRVYSSLHITGAETGRMSSSSPNLQNIPARKLPIFRTFFIPSPNSVMVVDDVSQQEPCILASESEDPTLIAAIKAGEDLHQAVADAIHMDRSIGKAINLGIGYGLSPHGLSDRVGITEEEATTIITNYFTRFSGVFNWIQKQRSFARNNGYVKTSSTGRRIYVNPYDNQWQNNAINAPIQGGAADFTKVWVRNYWERCRDLNIPYSLCMIVHDEIVMDVPKEYLKTNKVAVNDAFHETSASLFPKVPFRFEMEQGKSWACKQFDEEAYDEEEEEDLL